LAFQDSKDSKVREAAELLQQAVGKPDGHEGHEEMAGAKQEMGFNMF